ncbi:hypothetical protein ACP70R_029360 [Stipagrostis hirtigluma subsp. patula]
MSDEKGLVTRRRCPGSPVPASPPENDDLLLEILLRLPPAPSSLPRASLVCKRWRRLVADPGFLRRFRARHRRDAPLLGFFTEGFRGFSFTPTLDPPDRIPRGRFSLQLDDRCGILDCRRGLVLIWLRMPHQVLVWDPVTGDLRHFAIPQGFGDGRNGVVYRGAVLRVAGDGNGSGHPTHFKVVLVANDEEYTGLIARVYSTETGLWGNLISTPCTSMIQLHGSGALVGGSLYWLVGADADSVHVLELDLDRQCLALLDVPPDVPVYSLLAYASGGWWPWPPLSVKIQHPARGANGTDNTRYPSDRKAIRIRICIRHYPYPDPTPMKKYEIGYEISDIRPYPIRLHPYIQLWKRMTYCDGVAQWVLRRTVELDKLLSLNPEEGFYPMTFGFSHDNNVLFLATHIGVFMVQLESMSFKEPFKSFNIDIYHPFASVYATVFH